MMDYGDYSIYFWLFPAAFQIIIPLIIFCLWSVMKLPVALLGLLEKRTHIAVST